MESIKIEKDSSVSIPKPGNMKITVEMTEGLFEELFAIPKKQRRARQPSHDRNKGNQFKVTEKLFTYTSPIWRR